MLTIQQYLALAAASASLFALQYFVSNRRKLPHPPGPPCRPILGLDPTLIPKSEPWKRYAEWAKIYGPIFSFHILGRRVIVLNSLAEMTALLTKRASNYSERPLRTMYDIIMARRTSVFNIPASDERHRIYRRLLNGTLNARAVQAYHPVLEDEARGLLARLLDSPEQFEKHIRHTSVATIMRITYGYTVKEEDPFVSIIEEGFRVASIGATPGNWLVDVFPILRFVPAWFPGAGFQRKGNEWKALLDRMITAPFDWTKGQVATGDAEYSFVSHHCREALVDDVHIKKSAAGLYAGGADTVVSALTTFVLAMVLHPDSQRKAQAEIDAVVGHGRLPNCQDLISLPYLRCIMQEVLRWGPVAPLNLPHSPLHSDEYEGFYIEKDAAVFANLWAVLHDPEAYPDPETFAPDRFAAPAAPGDETLSPSPMEYAFGFGRRICPGIHFAEWSIMLNMARILSIFDILEARDEGGREIEPKVEFTTGITSRPKPFPCQIVPRSAEATQLVS